MCRWLVWCSHDPILLSEVVLESSNSLVNQSFNAGFHPGLCQKNNMRLNADGFGVGWYGKRGAAIYRSVKPAWNNRNLRELCGSIESQCIFAHVRAATPSSIVSEENCHPFRYGPLLFQHNGHVEGFHRIKRHIMNALPDELYNWISGTTDSEACFALLLSLIPPESISSGKVSPAEMQHATLGTIALLRDFIQTEQIDEGFSTFNFALTDGQTVVVTRYCDKAPRIPPPSLYYAFLPSDALRSHLIDGVEAAAPRGPAYGLQVGKKGSGAAGGDELARAEVSRKGSAALHEQCESGAFICASEPLTRAVDKWHLIEENSMISFSIAEGLLSGGLAEGSASSSNGAAEADAAATASCASQRDEEGPTAAALAATLYCRSTAAAATVADVETEAAGEVPLRPPSLTGSFSNGSASGKLTAQLSGGPLHSLSGSPLASPHASPKMVGQRPGGSAAVPPPILWSLRADGGDGAAPLCGSHAAEQQRSPAARRPPSAAAGRSSAPAMPTAAVVEAAAEPLADISDDAAAARVAKDEPSGEGVVDATHTTPEGTVAGIRDDLSPTRRHLSPLTQSHDGSPASSSPLPSGSPGVRVTSLGDTHLSNFVRSSRDKWEHAPDQWRTRFVLNALATPPGGRSS